LVAVLIDVRQAREWAARMIGPSVEKSSNYTVL